MLLAHGARSVVAVDVGHGQLDPRLAADPRVSAHEGLDARKLTAAIAGAPEAIVIDVSFISQTLALPVVLPLAARPAWLVSLVKPQFEVGRDKLAKGRSRTPPTSRPLAPPCAPASRGSVGEASALSPRRSPAETARANSSMQRGMSEVRRELTIASLNARGEGVASDGTVAPLALPGETVVIEADGERARVVAVEVAAPERAEPICPYFGRCGGCAAQHMRPALYANWKRDGVVRSLQRAGVAAEVGPLVDAHGEGRRRATFHSRYADGRETVGFMRARARDVVAIDACPLFAPGLSGAIGAARALAADLRGAGKPLDIQATATLGGLDFDLRGAGPLDAAMRRKLVATAERLDLARVACHGEVVVERRPPRVAFGEALAVPPPGGFLQATEAGERALAEGAAAALTGARRVADLFCGAGAFALRLARDHEVVAVDFDAPAVAALRRAAGAAPDLRPIRAEVRDLVHRPLIGAELAAFDAVLFDPPRAGAEAQARALVAAGPPLVVAVSCSPESFARDARILVEGGYALGPVSPLDQFRYSPHVEILAAFRRRPVKRHRGVLG